MPPKRFLVSDQRKNAIELFSHTMRVIWKYSGAKITRYKQRFDSIQVLKNPKTGVEKILCQACQPETHYKEILIPHMFLFCDWSCSRLGRQIIQQPSFKLGISTLFCRPHQHWHCGPFYTWPKIIFLYSADIACSKVMACKFNKKTFFTLIIDSFVWCA